MPPPRKAAVPARARGALSDQAYDALRSALREGRIRPGDRVRERDLAARLGLGRTPVREALKRLAVHGVLAQESGLGLVFRKLSQREIVEIHAVWAALQALAAQLAAQHASAVEIGAMKGLLARLAEEAAAGRPEARATARKLDRLICESGRNAFLTRHIDQLIDTVGFQTGGVTSFAVPGRPQAFAAEMRGIVEAIAARDPERAARLTREHNETGLAARLALEFAAD